MPNKTKDLIKQGWRVIDFLLSNGTWRRVVLKTEKNNSIISTNAAEVDIERGVIINHIDFDHPDFSWEKYFGEKIRLKIANSF